MHRKDDKREKKKQEDKKTRRIPLKRSVQFSFPESQIQERQARNVIQRERERAKKGPGLARVAWCALCIWGERKDDNALFVRVHVCASAASDA